MIPGAGDPRQVAVPWMFCGTAVCRACAAPNCAGESHSGLDRDGDLEVPTFAPLAAPNARALDWQDLKACPFPLRHHRYQRYPQFFEDVFLRVCGP